MIIQIQTPSENDETDIKEENEKSDTSTAKFMETWNLDLPRSLIVTDSAFKGL